jgi:uncharacterized membrane protein
MEFLKHFGVVAGLFVIIDSIWIAGVANKFYKKQLSALLLAKPKFLPAIIFYIIYITAVVVLVLTPGLSHSYSWVVGHAALFGLAMYATYDLTNISTLKNWPVAVTVVDLIWGTALTTAVSTASYAVFH